MKAQRTEQDPKREKEREKMVQKKATTDLKALKAMRPEDMNLEQLKKYAWSLNIPAVGTKRYILRSVKRALLRRKVRVV